MIPFFKPEISVRCKFKTRACAHARTHARAHAHAHQNVHARMRAKMQNRRGRSSATAQIWCKPVLFCIEVFVGKAWAPEVSRILRIGTSSNLLNMRYENEIKKSAWPFKRYSSDLLQHCFVVL